MADIDQPQVRADGQSEPTSSNIDRLFAELNDRFISAAQWRLLEAGVSPQERERALIAVAVTAFDTVASMAVRTAHADEAADQCRVAISEAAVALMTHWRTELQGMRPDFFSDLRLALSSRVHHWGAEALRMARERATRGVVANDSPPPRDHTAYARWLNDTMTAHSITPNRLASVGEHLSRATVVRAMNGQEIRKDSRTKLEKAISEETKRAAPPAPAY